MNTKNLCTWIFPALLGSFFIEEVMFAIGEDMLGSSSNNEPEALSRSRFRKHGYQGKLQSIVQSTTNRRPDRVRRTSQEGSPRNALCIPAPSRIGTNEDRKVGGADSYVSEVDRFESQTVSVVLRWFSDHYLNCACLSLPRINHCTYPGNLNHHLVSIFGLS